MSAAFTLHVCGFALLAMPVSRPVETMERVVEHPMIWVEPVVEKPKPIPEVKLERVKPKPVPRPRPCRVRVLGRRLCGGGPSGAGPAAEAHSAAVEPAHHRLPPPGTFTGATRGVSGGSGMSRPRTGRTI